MRSVRLLNRTSPGDCIAMTAVVRDLKHHFGDEISIEVEARSLDVWLNNPYLARESDANGHRQFIDCSRIPLVDRSNESSLHYLESFHLHVSNELGVDIALTEFKPDLHISVEEANTYPFRPEVPYWVIVAGGKTDYSVKWWPTDAYQGVVDAFDGRIHFVQAGAKDDHHPLLKRVTDLVGATSLREFIHLIYHAQGVVAPVTCAMHIAAAFSKPCVVIAGGREPPQWEMYPGHQFLHTVGQLNCCSWGGCWNSRVVRINDGCDDHNRRLCTLPVADGERMYAGCMAAISPKDVIRGIERYFESANLDRTEKRVTLGNEGQPIHI